MRANTALGHAAHTQKQPSFSVFGRRRILTSGFSSHSLEPSDHSPFHSYLCTLTKIEVHLYQKTAC